jgi:dTDP-4-dehydrorhamnose 3,5-epimerase
MPDPTFQAAIQDPQTVTTDGTPLRPVIDGLVIQHRPPNTDARGELIEVFNPAWGFHPDPLVYAYAVVAYPGSVRAWVMHKKQDDRIFVLGGRSRWAFYDARAESPTYKMLNVFVFTERHRVLFTIPRGVFHGTQNIGQMDATFINMPSKPFNHEHPDKYRLPVKNDLIPFDFST